MKKYILILTILITSFVQGQVHPGVVDSQVVSAGGEATIGGDTDESTYTNSRARTDKRAAACTMSEDGTLTSISVYNDTNASADNLVMGVYSDNAGVPNTLLRQTVEATDLVAGWNTLNLTSGLTVTSGTTIWLAFHSEGIVQKWEAHATILRDFESSAYNATMSATFTSSGTALYTYAIYATYTKI